MAGPFRFSPPVLGRGVVTRPRLLRALLARFTNRCTLIVAGAGHGKTTLLAQAAAENRLAPRGDEVWLALEAGDADASVLGRDLLRALDAPSDIATASAIADAVWRRAPTQVCLLLDDAHVIAPESTGSRLIAELVDALPANGHLVIAARTAPELPYARLATQGALLRVEEPALGFDRDELTAFAAVREVDPDGLTGTGGWPAMAELVASAGADLAGSFLWQEVLEPMGFDQRRMLTVLCDIGGGDDRLLSAALGTPVEFEPTVPLIAVDADGWYEPHGLWHTVAALDLPASERRDIRRRAAHDLVARARLDAAFTLLADAELWDDVPPLLSAACRSGMRPTAAELRRWLGRCPTSVSRTPSGLLATGVLAALTAPNFAAKPLKEAVAGFRAAGDADGELSAISHLGHVAWWQRDLGALAELAPRVAELEAAGNPTARGLAAIGRALVCNISGDGAGVLAEVDSVPPGVLDPRWEAVIGWLRGLALHSIGDDAGFDAELERALPLADPAFRVTVACTLTASRWSLGHVDSVLPEAAALVAASEASGIAQDIAAIAATSARACAYLGQVEAARTYLVRARAVAAHLAPPAHVHIALADAAIALAEGDEQRAQDALRASLEIMPIDDPRSGSTWFTDVAVTYVLVPESRPTWDAMHGSARFAWSREIAACVAAGREPGIADPIAVVDVAKPDLVRGVLPFAFAAELAVRLHEAGRTEVANALLEALGEPGRMHVRRLRTSAAGALLSGVAVAPSVPVRVRAFGALCVDGRELERVRVRELLGFLLLNRTTTRAEVMARMWPDLDDRAAANNFRVTLSHLLRALEPDRTEGEAAYFVRQNGGALRLVDDGLDVDLDAFDSHFTAAEMAERDGAPSVALEHYLAATDLYGGDLLADLPDIAWADIDRDRTRGRFVRAAVRAGELLAAADDLDRAEHLAQRALAIDEWSEPAYGVLVAAALTRDDRSTALRLLARCQDMLGELGVESSEATRRLIRRARSKGASR